MLLPCYNITPFSLVGHIHYEEKQEMWLSMLRWPLNTSRILLDRNTTELREPSLLCLERVRLKRYWNKPCFILLQSVQDFKEYHFDTEKTIIERKNPDRSGWSIALMPNCHLTIIIIIIDNLTQNWRIFFSRKHTDTFFFFTKVTPINEYVISLTIENYLLPS